MRGALELAHAVADEGPGDDAGDLQWLQQALGTGADRIEPVQAEMRFMRGDLELGIRRGVADRLSRADVLLAQARVVLGARGVAIAEDSGVLCFRNEALQE